MTHALQHGILAAGGVLKNHRDDVVVDGVTIGTVPALDKGDEARRLAGRPVKYIKREGTFKYRLDAYAWIAI